MNKFNCYLDSLLDLPVWIGFPIFAMSIIFLVFLAFFSLYALIVLLSPWFLLLPVSIWAVCAINWWVKNR